VTSRSEWRFFFAFCAKGGRDAACSADFDIAQIRYYKQHHTRPCQQRNDGAPTVIDRAGSSKARPPAKANGTILTGVQGEAKVPGAGVEGKAGAELSTKEGATISAAVSGHAGPVNGEVKVDTNGVHTSANPGANNDVKVGAHGQVGLGVGVTINLSQAARAAEHARESGVALANTLINKYMPSGPIF
jgi:hypothetical protein